MAPELMNRLVCAKALFLNGVDALTRPAPTGPALALLSFQDAVEMALGAVADHRNVALKPAKEFLDLIKQVQDTLGKDLPYWTGMNQLNKARVALKHHGIFPSQETLAKARGETEGFLLHLAREAFDLDFKLLSMASLVHHTRAANWLRRAEAFADGGDSARCIEACAISMALFRRAYVRSPSFREYESILRSSQSRTGMPAIEDGIFRLAKRVEEDLGELKENLEWLSSGVSVSDQKKFEQIAPNVAITLTGRLHLSRFGQHFESAEASAFSLEFVTQTILRLQKTLEPRQATRRNVRDQVRQLRVVRAAEVFLDDESPSPEILRTAEPGEWLTGRPEKDDAPDWVAIIEGEDWARVRRECVEVAVAVGSSSRNSAS